MIEKFEKVQELIGLVTNSLWHKQGMSREWKKLERVEKLLNELKKEIEKCK